MAGEHAPGADGSLIPLDLDATIVIAHSDRERAAPTWKHTFGFAARLVKGGRRLRLRLPNRWHWADLIATACTRLQALPAP
ncbi:MAG TPA: hypothetical protein VEL76_23890 [Gemmataceae bacterium]|nr:hypothetical protein [Gemmataceae bacterium]